MPPPRRSSPQAEALALNVKGHRVGPYDIEREVGRGGQGVVFLARDPRTGRLLAIKALDLLTESAVQRLEREARAATAINHPGILSVVDSGPGWIASPYVPGGPLSAVLRGFDVAQAVVVLMKVAEAVGAAHAAGIVHRDLKPANVLMAPAGPVVADWGLAAITGEESELTRSSDTLGTPAYMAPEQTFGDRASTRSDVWAIGVMLWEGVTGRRPFAEPTSKELFIAIQKGPPSPPRSLPRDVRAVLSKALARDPSDRYPSAGLLAVDLRAIARGNRPAAQLPAPWRQAARWVRREPLAAGLLVALALAIAAIVALSSYVIRP